MKRTRRNPPGVPIVPLVLIAGGAYLLLRKPPAAPVAGVGNVLTDAWDSVKGTINTVTNQVRSAVQQGAGVTLNLASKVIDSPLKAGILTAALPITALTTLLPTLVGAAKLVGKPEGGEGETVTVNQYTDRAGNVITEAQYRDLMISYMLPDGREISKEDFDKILAVLRERGSNEVPIKSTYTYEGGTYDRYTIPNSLALLDLLNPQVPIKTEPSTVYKDANGTIITKEQYESLLAQLQVQADFQKLPPPAPVVSEGGTRTNPGATVVKLPPKPPTSWMLPDPNITTGGKVPDSAQYFDANGNEISSTEFNRQMNNRTISGALPPIIGVATRYTLTGKSYRVPTPPAVAPAGSSTTPAVQYAPSGGSSASDYSLPPAYTPPTQQPQYSSEQAPAAAPGEAAKVNPAITVGVLAAVPLLFMMGGK